jgi:hypothetical protein
MRGTERRGVVLRNNEEHSSFLRQTLFSFCGSDFGTVGVEPHSNFND